MAGIEVGDAFFKVGFEKDRVKKSLASLNKIIIAGSAAAVVAIAGIGIASLKIANDVNKASKKIAASLGLPTAEAEKFRTIIKEVYRDNFGDTLQDVGQAVQDVASQLKVLGITGEEEITKITKGAIALRDTFDVDVNKTMEASRALMQEFGLSSEQALDFITTGFQRGLNSSDDFLESIGEFSVQFKEGGADAGQFFSLLESGFRGGAFLGTDRAADAFKEFRVRIQDGAKGTIEALDAIGISSKKLAKDMATGQVTAAQAFTLVQLKLANVKDSGEQLRRGVALMGTQFEDLGAQAIFALDLTKTKMEDLKGATSSLNAQYATLGNAVQGIQRMWTLAMEEVGTAMLPIINDNMPAIQSAMDELVKVAPAIADGFVSAVKVIMPALQLLLDFLLDTIEATKVLFRILEKVTGGATGETRALFSAVSSENQRLLQNQAKEEASVTDSGISQAFAASGGGGGLDIGAGLRAAQAELDARSSSGSPQADQDRSQYKSHRIMINVETRMLLSLPERTRSSLPEILEG